MEEQAKLNQCRYCGKEIIIDSSKKKGQPRKYCDIICRTRFNAKSNYQKNKNNPEYKLKRRQQFQIWVVKNRVRFNEMMRVNARKRRAKQMEMKQNEGIHSS